MSIFVQFFPLHLVNGLKELQRVEKRQLTCTTTYICSNQFFRGHKKSNLGCNNKFEVLSLRKKELYHIKMKFFQIHQSHEKQAQLFRGTELSHFCRQKMSMLKQTSSLTKVKEKLQSYGMVLCMFLWWCSRQLSSYTHRQDQFTNHRQE